MPRNVLIMGSGRSGTSLAAGALATGDYYMGDNLLEADSGNPKGYFEDRRVNNVNEDILDPLVPGQPLGIVGELLFPDRLKYGRRWIAEIPLEAEIPEPDGIEEEIRRLVGRRPFCFKDPRFSYTLPVWRPLLPDETGFVVVFRDPLVTARSMVKETSRVYPRLRFDIERGLRVWTCVYRQILDRHVPEGGSWLFVHYDQFFGSREALSRLEKFSGLEVSADFPDRDLRRTQAPPDVAVPSEATDLYERLCERAGYSPGPGGRG